MVRYFCDNCNTEIESANDSYKVFLPTPKMVLNNKTSDDFYLAEKFLCAECTEKLYNLIYNRDAFVLKC